MDPNATLKMMEGMTEGNADELLDRMELAEDLVEWLNRGGFAPFWRDYPQATAYFKEIAPSLGLKPKFYPWR